MSRGMARVALRDDDEGMRVLNEALQDTRSYYIEQLIEAAHRRNSPEIIRLSDMLGCIDDLLVDILQAGDGKVRK